MLHCLLRSFPSIVVSILSALVEFFRTRGRRLGGDESAMFCLFASLRSSEVIFPPLSHVGMNLFEKNQKKELAREAHNPKSTENIKTTLNDFQFDG